MSRAERERSKIAAERWPYLRALILNKFPNEFFFKIKDFNAVLLERVSDLPLQDKKLTAVECRDFIKYFSDRYDDTYMVLDGLGANIPSGKIPYEGDSQQHGVVRIKLLYSELARLIRNEDFTWKP